MSLTVTVLIHKSLLELQFLRTYESISTDEKSVANKNCNDIVYTELKTPVSVNDDAEQTAVKQVYTPEDLNDSHIECAQRVMDRTLIDVNSDNVESVFDQINNEAVVDSGTSETVDHLVKLYRDLPKDLFIGRIMSENSSDETKLKDLRSHIFIEIKNFDDFPFNLAVDLKRRKQTKNGDCAALKLSGDIYTLISVFEGGPYDDLKELFSVSKSVSEVFNQSIIVNSSGTDPNGTPCKCDTNLESFRGLLADVQSELKSMKEEIEQQKSNFQEQIDSIKTELDSMNTDIAESVEELQNTASNCRQLMTDLGDEQRNCSSTIKNDVKQIRTELMSLCEHVELKYSELDRKIPNTRNIERRLTKLENNLRVTGTCESSKSAPDQVTVDLTGVDEAPSCRDSTYANVNGNKPSSMNASFVAEK